MTFSHTLYTVLAARQTHELFHNRLQVQGICQLLQFCSIVFVVVATVASEYTHMCIYLRPFTCCKENSEHIFAFHKLTHIVFLFLFFFSLSCCCIWLHRTCRKSILYLLFYELQLVSFHFTHFKYASFARPAVARFNLLCRMWVFSAFQHPLLSSPLPSPPAVAFTCRSYRLIGNVCAAMKRRGT